MQCLFVKKMGAVKLLAAAAGLTAVMASAQQQEPFFIGLDNANGSPMTQGAIDFTELEQVVNDAKSASEPAALSTSQQMREHIRENYEGLKLLFQGDYEGAMREFRVTANAGNPAAMNTIGVLYQNGLGVPVDYAQAATWYERAISNGNYDAFYNLGVMLMEAPDGVEQDLPRALELFDQGCKGGDRGACEFARELRAEGV